nr:cubilin isoform X2 [Parasteatoda tepidariorum]
MKMVGFLILSLVLRLAVCEETTTESTTESTWMLTEGSTTVIVTTQKNDKHYNKTVRRSCEKWWSAKDYELTHPSFPEEYENSVLCRYTIQKSDPSVCGLEITFRKFDLETSAGCEKDFLAIEDERLCGHIPSQSVVQYPFDEDTDAISVVFGTNENVTKNGFQILFQQISICEEDLNAIPAIHACDVLITDPSGELVTHRSPEDARGDPVCRYTVGRRHSGYCQVELDFVDFNVEYSPGCIGSYVQLDGHRFCGTSLRGQKKNVTFDALGNVHIVYKTDTVRMDRGFHLLFRQLVCPPGDPVRPPGGSGLIGDRVPSSCSKIYYEKEFYLESPGFPNYYTNDLDCQLVIRRYRPSICKMDIRFLDFDVEQSPGCVYDFLELDSERLCGRILEDTVKTTDFLSYEKVLRFKTDSINPRPGFFLYVRQLDCGHPPPLPSSCDVHIWESEARITSPNYPLNYENNLRCVYTVHRLGDYICQLKINFLDFRLQNGSPGCYNDYLEMDGGWRACGDKFQGISRTLDFRVPEKVLIFSTDSWFTQTGFLLSVRQVPCSGGEGTTSGRLNGPTCDREFEAPLFDMRSELYPLSYPPNLNCRYLVRKVSQSVCQLRMTFTHFDLEASIACSRDYLIMDGERLCGSLPPNTTRTIRFDTPEKVFLFHSDIQIQGSGFEAIVQQVECPGGLPPDTATVVPSTGRAPPSDLPRCNFHYPDIRATISSPNYPNPYPNMVECRYAVHLQPGFCSVEFNFIDFSLEPPTPGLPCTRDFLDISGVRYCGQQLKGITKIESPLGLSKELVMTFMSDTVVNNKGFLASFRQVSCSQSPPPPPPRGATPPALTPGDPTCGGHLTGPFFDIRWPTVTDYGQTIECVHTVHRLGSDTCNLRVTFVTFDQGDARDCPRQFVQIGDHTLCGKLPAYTVRDYDFLDYTLIIRITSAQLPRPRIHLQVQQLPCGAHNPPSRLPPPTCDETFQGPGFELRSPYYPHGITSSVDCRYIVRKSSPFICHLELTFERFQLPESRQCYGNHLRIDTERLCGSSILPYSVRMYDFQTSEKLIHFSADHILPGTGFLIRGRQVPCTSSLLTSSGGNTDQLPSPSSAVRCDQSFGLDEFTIYSPGHPLHYPTDTHCRYVIIRSNSEVCGLEVTFVTFDLEDYYQCQRDYLDIDGERLCGLLPPQSIRNYVFHPADRTKVIIFHSDHATTKQGFILRVRQNRICPPSVPSLLPVSPASSRTSGSPSTPSSGCESTFFSAPRGMIRSPRFPGGYPSLHCIYTFVQLRGFCSLQVTFRDFDLLPGTNCIIDYLEIEGRRYCDGQLFQINREIPFPWNDSSTIAIMFHSDRGSFVHRGFHIDFEQVPCRRQGRNHREEVEPLSNSTVRYTSSPSSEWTSSFDGEWDDTKTTPRNASTVEYTT